MEREKKRKKVPFVAEAYHDYVKAINKDSKSISVHVTAITVTMFLYEKHCAPPPQING
jgi:phage gp46-like protein